MAGTGILPETDSHFQRDRHPDPAWPVLTSSHSFSRSRWPPVAPARPNPMTTARSESWRRRRSSAISSPRSRMPEPRSRPSCRTAQTPMTGSRRPGTWPRSGTPTSSSPSGSASRRASSTSSPTRSPMVWSSCESPPS
ncbi:MAG: hypothetical protein GWN07_21285, partial [Actinobacteria bacterium]|nr:hypothetical protein [Actinomycetota bacterium]NIS33000.1 hypothetical protein [Actinomycetota bacterium]NIU67935.1 hypothetical protein [Actinomycetota bacterium]NIW29725.1 hypothetical protein [Actinomycetota bacterium]NIX22223.1 hypothetical protein [Actinomycetota bacterium]